jgi:hypothetical protein
MLTLCKSTVLAAAFLAGVAIAANADPASTSAAGTVANPASGSQPQGRGLAALPPSSATPPHYTTFATGKNQIEEYSNEVEDTRHHRDRGGAGDQRVRLR